MTKLGWGSAVAALLAGLLATGLPAESRSTASTGPAVPAESAPSAGTPAASAPPPDSVGSHTNAGSADADYAADSASDAQAKPPGALRIGIVSSRPDAVTGGDALVEVAVPAGVPADQVQIRVGSRDVSEAFQPHRAHVLRGRIDGLTQGRNTITADAPGTEPAHQQAVNHARSGPLLAGSQESPYVCDTEEFTLVTGTKLGKPLDEDCSVRTRTDYVYRATGGELRPLPEGTTRPRDLSWTTTNTGQKVPYIVRVETGTINRAIYEIAMLADPAADDEPDPWHRSPGWNGKLIYTFGGGCPGGWYVQGRETGGVTEDGMLKQGYAVASSSLNVFGNNCNDLLASETMAMVKERFVERHGVPEFTIGWGCSGGSYQAHQIGDNYPGLLDGIIAACSFPDVGFGTVPTITDARLLEHYFTDVAPGTFNKKQQRQVAGFGRWESISNLADAGGRIDPRIFCPEQLREADRYDPKTNPDGARCDVYSHTQNAYGVDPSTGKPRRPLDNVGIQYGLHALREGQISPQQFLDLNDRIGGFDTDANHVAKRTKADPKATRAAYQTGRMLNGGGGLSRMPIIDYRTYSDDAPDGDIHQRFQSFSTRERLRKANGTAANHVMLVEDDRRGGFTTANPVLAKALAQLDTWLSDLHADGKYSGVDPSGADQAYGQAGGVADGQAALQRVIRNKPDGLVDACWTRDTPSKKIEETQELGVGTTRCNTEFPVWPSPRMVAGADVAGDVVKCQLRPIDPSEYDVPWTPRQLKRLHRIFPHGVCDWDRSGVGQQPLGGTWAFFGDEPGDYTFHASLPR